MIGSLVAAFRVMLLVVILMWVAFNLTPESFELPPHEVESEVAGE